MQELYFTSDTHFSHYNIIEYSNRPYETVHEMDEALIKGWNEVVGPKDRVYHLGDFSFAPKNYTLHNIMPRLNGSICLLVGNHDRKRLNEELKKAFEWTKDYYELAYDDKKVIMCHYPFDTWNRSHHGSWSMHGHCHGSLTTVRSGRMDVGVDTNADYRPYSWGEIKEFMANQEDYVPIDHHKPRGR